MTTRTVRDAMTREMINVREDARLGDAARLLDTYRISGMPVVDRGGRLVGVLSQTDLLRARAIDHLWRTPPCLVVRHLMTAPAITASESMPLDEADPDGGTTDPSARGRRRRRTHAGRRVVGVRPRPRDDPAMTVTKDPGAPRETQVVAEAKHLFDVQAYVDDFNRDVMNAYRGNAADAELPADRDAARSIIPPGTAAARDFSHLAPQIPEFIAYRCVGCMSCVNACPDTAILGIALQTSIVEARIVSFAETEPISARASESARAHFVETKKYGEVPARHGLEPALFGIFVDPVHCKGCAECVEVCVALGYDALRMIDKARADANGEPTLEQYARDIRLYRSLPPTPPEYRNAKALADVMLGDHAIGYVGGAGSCSGCGEATAIRMLVAATGQTYGEEGMGIVASTGCNSVFGSTYPYNPYLVPWTNSLRERSRRCARHPRALGPGGERRPPHLGDRRRRRDV